MGSKFVFFHSSDLLVHMISRINYYVMFCFSAVHIPYILCDSGLGVLSEHYRSQPISHGQPSSV